MGESSALSDDYIIIGSGPPARRVVGVHEGLEQVLRNARDCCAWYRWSSLMPASSAACFLLMGFPPVVE